MLITARDITEVFHNASISKPDIAMFNRGMVPFPSAFASTFNFQVSSLLLFIFYNLYSQVASLQFGNFYDAQYVKMYNIFMVQLQVRLI